MFSSFVCCYSLFSCAISFRAIFFFAFFPFFFCIFSSFVCCSSFFSGTFLPCHFFLFFFIYFSFLLFFFFVRFFFTFKIMVFPAAKAGATFQESIISFKTKSYFFVEFCQITFERSHTGKFH
eukprot:Phypoly_transcript_14103.p1 GENE.Phypoly_transcript_14103~~Phypoly_transcript_14103.p1  ORF type:complete len:122 (+),score=8.82 Phypoly_transcript_14103:483-848(+)